MFISQKRLEREKQEVAASTKMLTEAILAHVSQGLLFLDAKGKILPQVSQSLAALFRRRDFNNLTFEKLLIPHVTSKVLSRARSYLAVLRESAPTPDTMPNPLTNVEVRLKNADGTFETAHFCFEFSPLDMAAPGMWMVRVTDISARVQQSRELEDLRAQLNTHSEILRSILRMGRARFAAALQKIADAMKSVNDILKKPAREEAAFRHKLEETLDQVDRVRRAGKTLKLSALESAARDFEDALHELGNRRSLSGSDFLPLAVKLDALFGQFAAVRTLITSPRSAQRSEREPRIERRRSRSPGILVTPEPPPIPVLDTVADAVFPKPAAKLERALTELTADIATACHKSVKLECADLHLIPAEHQATVKQIAVQLIRNAVIHGIELPEERRACGKPVQGSMRLGFSLLDGGGYELAFQDDGRGLDPDKVRSTAVAKGLIGSEAAEKLRDRQAIKLIFKSGFTTVAEDGGAGGDTGLAFVRRHVHRVGGKIALASLMGHEVRFKVLLPTVEEARARAAAEAAVEVAAESAAQDAHPADAKVA
jgi:signal transduction histidine kinase